MFFQIYLVIITKNQAILLYSNEKVIILEKYINFGKTLKFIRKSFDYTQETVSRHLNIERQTYSHYETGRNLPSAEILYRLASLYNIGVENFYLPLYDPRNDIVYQPELFSNNTITKNFPVSGEYAFSNNSKNCVLIAVPSDIADLVTILSSFSKEDLKKVSTALSKFQKNIS